MEWIEQSKGNRSIEYFFKGVMKLQKNVLYEFPEGQRAKGYGRAARAIIDGENGGIFLLWFCENGIEPKPEDVAIRNEIYMKESTLWDLVTPDVKLDALVALIKEEGSLQRALYRLRPRLYITTAFANRLISVGGDNPDIDSEAWAQIIDKSLIKVAFPITVEALLSKPPEGKEKVNA